MTRVPLASLALALAAPAPLAAAPAGPAGRCDSALGALDVEVDGRGAVAGTLVTAAPGRQFTKGDEVVLHVRRGALSGAAHVAGQGWRAPVGPRGGVTFTRADAGVGVTFRMRNDLPAAPGWYKKALAVNPDFGDAYHDMACVHALQAEKELALRDLQIAAPNGHATAAGIDAVSDLAPLHGEPAYRTLVKAHP